MNDHTGPDRTAALRTPTNSLGFPLRAGIPPTTAQHGPSVREVLQMIRPRWRMILAALAFGLAAALILSLIATPQYRATATIEISEDEVQVVQLGREAAIPVNNQQFLETQYGLLRSRSLAERVAKDMRLQNNPLFADPGAPEAARLDQAAATLVEKFDVKPVDDSRLVRLSYQSTSPSLAADVANTFAQDFIQSALERRFQANDFSREFLQRRLAEVRARLEDSERKLVLYAQAENIVSVPGQNGEGSEGVASTSLPAASLGAANTELASAQNARVAAEQRFIQARRGSPTSEVLQSSSLEAMKTQLAQLKSTYAQKRNTLTPDHPEMRELESSIAAVEGDIARERRTILGTLQAEYQAAAGREKELRQRVSGLTSSVQNLRGRTIQYNILQRDVDTNRQLYDALLQRVKEVGISAGVGKNVISIVDMAKPPSTPFEPNTSQNAIIGALIGLACGVAGAVALGILTNKMHTMADLEDRLGISALGVVPLAPKDQSIEDSLAAPRSALFEAYASLRSELHFATKGELRSLLVTSTGSTEGKTTTSYALAQNFARIGRSTLLIDADIRHPSFEVQAKVPGLSEALSRGLNVSELILPTEIDNLAILPGGQVPRNPSDLLADGRLAEIIRECESRYDVVIIDGPPLLGLADAPLLAAVVQRVLLVVRSGGPLVPAARNATERLRAAGADIVGGVLTMFDAKTYGYGYGYGYGYEYGHRPADGTGGKARILVPATLPSSRAKAVSRSAPAEEVAIIPVLTRSPLMVPARVVFWLSLLAATFVALWPSEILTTSGDKAQHIAAFTLLTALGVVAYPRALLAVALGLAAFGGAIELAQMLPGVGRDPDVWDWLADGAGIVVVAAAAALWRSVKVQRRTS